ncbi:MAG: alpha-mannosidase [Romboutsia sp.]
MKKVYIISHSHWDREWYLPYEKHHMRLVELIDDLLELFEKEPEFNSFHLDGQTIALDDYLQVRPQKKELLEKYIKEGRLRIGPFYILQDDFLISSESNTRNMLIGMEESKKWGGMVNLGYFPDTFGNMGQTPQMMKQVGIDVAVFGRGVKPTGFNNVVINDEKFASQFSEMWWNGPDNSKILGILFANWYSNGNEIPVDKEEAKKFWDRKLNDASMYASTEHLLMMNGCDHQPVQKNVISAIKVARELYPEIEFIHSNFEDYIEAMKKDLPESLSTIDGEITSQETEGWYTLANTASARIYLKQMNTDVSRQLENITEPLATMAYETASEYPHDQLRYAWKTYMQNHPHDSICGCSVDEVHDEMVTRFKKAKHVGEYLADEAANKILSKIDTASFSDDSKPFVIFNTSGSSKTGIVETKIEWKRLPFSVGGPPKLYNELKEEIVPKFKIIDKDGKIVKAEIVKTEVDFGYDLPKDGFRIPFMATYVTVRMLMEDMSAMSWETFALAEGDSDDLLYGNMIKENGRILENDNVKIVIENNGQLNITDKITGKVYDKLLTFENVGDIGNEYIFKQPVNDKAILSSEFDSKVEVLTDNELYAEVLLTQDIIIPISADERLKEECRAVYEFRQRKAERSKKTSILTLKTKILLEKGSKQVKFETTFDNQMEDHRLRVLFPTGILTDTHEAESIYEVVRRPNDVTSSWTNPSNPQHQHSFVNIGNKNHGVTVANYGLNEYEILKENGTIAVTLLRAVGELGDWGYFDTPEAQCKGKQLVKYAIEFHGENNKLKTYQNAINFQIPFSTYQTDIHKGDIENKKVFMNIEGESFVLTALKRKENSDEIIVRGYNATTETMPVDVNIDGYKAGICNLIEEKQEEEINKSLKPAEIRTYIIEKK